MLSVSATGSYLVLTLPLPFFLTYINKYNVGYVSLSWIVFSSDSVISVLNIKFILDRQRNPNPPSTASASLLHWLSTIGMCRKAHAARSSGAAPMQAPASMPQHWHKPPVCHSRSSWVQLVQGWFWWGEEGREGNPGWAEGSPGGGLAQGEGRVWMQLSHPCPVWTVGTDPSSP